MVANGEAGAARRGARLLFAGNLVAQACALARYTLLARILGPEQLGLAVTLILTAQFFELVSESGSDRFLIQDADGDTPRVQRMVHLISLARGVAIATALVVFARPIADFYRQPVLAGGLVALAAAPLIAGFLHFDLRRMQRHHDFRREGATMLAAESMALVATAVAAFVLRDFTAAVYGLIVRAAVMVAASRITAERRYEIGWSREHARRLGAFAAPLLLNGLLLFAAGQGDRLLIGNRLGVAELGRYSAVMLLIFYPSAMIMRYFHAVQLPRLAAARGEPSAFRAALDGLAGEALLLSVLMLAGFALVAPFAAPMLFGRVFDLPAALIAVIGVLQICRFIRIWPTTQAVAVGRSGVVLANSLIRLSALPCAIIGLRYPGGLNGLISGFAIGELVALVLAVVLTDRAVGTTTPKAGSRLVAFLAVCATVPGAAYVVEKCSALPAMAAVMAAAALVGGVVWSERDALGRSAAPLRRRARSRGSRTRKAVE